MIKKIVLLAAAVIFVTSCFSSPEKRYFQIHLSIEKGEPTPDKIVTVLVNRVEIAEFYDDYRIVYRESPYELNYYAYDFWILRPAKHIRQVLTRYFKKIDDIKTGEPPSYIVNTQVLAIEEVDRKGARFGRLAIEFQLNDYKSGQRIMTYAFDDKLPIIQKKIENFPKIISRILKNRLYLFIKKINRLEAGNDKKN